MRLLISVDFSNKNFNSDFTLSNALLSEHTVLLVTNQKQLEYAYPAYDLLIIGKSSWKIEKGQYKCLDYNDYETSDMLLEKIKKDYLSE